MQTKEKIIADILSVGLFVDKRGNLYGEQYAPYLNDKTGSWQNPDEFADLFLFLADKSISSFLNIGTFNGCAFNLLSDFLLNLQPTRCVTIDPIDHMPNKKFGREYVAATSDDYVGQKFDLVFIDGDHSYDSVMHDYHNVGKHARYCVLHDIDDMFILRDRALLGGSCRAWRELKDTKKYVEFISPTRPIPVMGIGVLIQ